MTTTTGLRRIFKALVMNPMSVDRVDFYDPGYLVVHNGRIESLSSDDPRSQWPLAEFHDLSGLAILPGFVDTHVHLPQLAVMGVASQSLLEWLNDYTFPEEARFADAKYAHRVSELFFDALIANGTTCASIYCSIHEEATSLAFEIAARKGLRAFIGKTMMDRNSPEPLLEATNASLDASVRLFERWDGAGEGRLRYVFSPRFAGTCSMELMREVATIAHERRAFVQSHLAENTDEVKWIESLFPGNSSYTDVYAHAGLLGERTIMGHCIHLEREEVSLLANSSTGVAFCPYSNRALHSGLMPYDHLQQAGLKIGLGSDVGGGPTLSMFRQMGEAMHSANASRPCLSVEGALCLATLGGANILGLADRIGNFAEGKDADFVVADYRRLDPLPEKNHYDSPHDILSRLCYRGDAACVQAVYMRGNIEFSQPA